MKKLSNYFEALNFVFWTQISKSVRVNSSSIGLFRILTGCFLLVFYKSYRWLSEWPDAIFTPPILSFANFAEGFPDFYVMQGIDFARLALIFAIIFGIRTRISVLIYIALTVFCNSFLFSLGKINHDENLLLAMLTVLSFSGWGQRYALVPDSKIKYDSSIASLSILGVIICFGMFTAGYGKALNWVDFNLQTSGFASWFYSGYIVLDRPYFIAPYIPQLPFYLFEVFDYTAVMFELSPLLFLLISKRAWYFWLLAACFFHLINILTLNISFTGHFLVYMAFVDYTGIFNWLSERFSLFKLKLFLGISTASFFMLHIINLIYRDDYHSIYELVSLEYYQIFYFSVGILLWIVAIMVFSYKIFYHFKDRIIITAPVNVLVK